MMQQTVKSASIIGQEDDGGMSNEFLGAYCCDVIINSRRGACGNISQGIMHSVNV
jgi:hypothetical protein